MDFAPKAENDILIIIRRLESEISQRQEALIHLKRAAEIIGLPLVGTAAPSGIPYSEVVTSPNLQIPISSRVDEFIDLLTENQEFSLDQVVAFIENTGVEVSDKVRANISSALSRRKGKGIDSLARGFFKKNSENMSEDNHEGSPKTCEGMRALHEQRPQVDTIDPEISQMKYLSI